MMKKNIMQRKVKIPRRYEKKLLDEYTRKADLEIEARARERIANNSPPPGCHYDPIGSMGAPGLGWTREEIMYRKGLAEAYDRRNKKEEKEEMEIP